MLNRAMNNGKQTAQQSNETYSGVKNLFMFKFMFKARQANKSNQPMSKDNKNRGEKKAHSP